MAYDPTSAGFVEASRLWVRQQITSNLGLLNSALSRDALTPLSALTSACVFKGDPQKLPDVSVAPLMFLISGGGRMDNMDLDVTGQEYFGGIGYRLSIYTNIEVCVHPDAMPNSSTFAQVESRETLLDRVEDWLYACCFNTPAAVNPSLSSHQFAVPPAVDMLDMAHILSFERRQVYKSFANSQTLDCLHARHTAQLIGNL